MKAFIIGRMKIHSRDWMEAYFSKVPDLIKAHSGMTPSGSSPAMLVAGGSPRAVRAQSAPRRTRVIMERLLIVIVRC